MKKLRPFLALLLSCWLLVFPVLADNDDGGASDGAPSSSGAVSDGGSSSSSEAPSPPPSQDTSSSQDPPPGGTHQTETPSGGGSSAPDHSADRPDFSSPVTDDKPDPSESGMTTPSDPVQTDPSTYPIPNEQLVPDVIEVPIEVPVEVPVEQSHQIYSITTIPDFALAALKSDTGTTLAQVVEDLFGKYTPRVQTVTTYVDGDLVAVEEQYVPGIAGLDWEWLSGVFLFSLMLYCLFRLLGGAVKYG